jgi:hypothetical protein
MIDPTQQATPGQPPEATPKQGGITIVPQGDGMFLVFEQNGPSDPLRKPLDLDAALEQARQYLGGAGQSEAEPAQDDADALFGAGFNQARGIPLNRS